MKVHRTRLILRPDAKRVFFRPFEITDAARISRIVARVMSINEREAEAECRFVLSHFVDRHTRLRDYLLERFESVRDHLITDKPLSESRRLLLGSYFTQEYSLEAAALFNPSIVPHPDQSGLDAGALRFVLSLRAVGEGHISSIVFRTGMIAPDGTISVSEPTPFVTAATPVPEARHDKAGFERRLSELGLRTRHAIALLAELGDSFTAQDLERVVSSIRRRDRDFAVRSQETVQGMIALVRANYEITFDPGSRLSERVIFPSTAAESRGIEDARFVLFREDDGSVAWHGTYTAYDGRVILPQLVTTDDFLRFRIASLNGPEVRNKGFALFPRRIGGRYAMLSRQDNENIHLMFSDSIHFWDTRQTLLRPTHPWEFVQLGNCGSPIETDAGWLVLTHGVGPMRRYTIGAILLDRDDPSRVIGRLREPLLEPIRNEREGYVPNVVYSCGALVHAGRLILPYAMSDQCASFATVPLDELIAELTDN
ncbi:glycosidase [Opitutaceae bacterium TAV4]|nr:glycosidase [Opitutaceae bacterium TAV4]RRJ98765.1 glycosidase [Opitutaceae bacterium TAV3]